MRICLRFSNSGFSEQMHYFRTRNKVVIKELSAACAAFYFMFLDLCVWVFCLHACLIPYSCSASGGQSSMGFLSEPR